jgi:hypothetical protein
VGLKEHGYGSRSIDEKGFRGNVKNSRDIVYYLVSNFYKRIEDSVYSLSKMK